MKHKVYTVKLRPECCNIGVIVQPDARFPDGTETLDLVVKKMSAGAPLVPMDGAPRYKHGGHPFTKIYDIRNSLALYKDPQVFAWLGSDGLATYMMVEEA